MSILDSVQFSTLSQNMETKNNTFMPCPSLTNCHKPRHGLRTGIKTHGINTRRHRHRAFSISSRLWTLEVIVHKIGTTNTNVDEERNETE
jgi:hypothetical protein